MFANIRLYVNDHSRPDCFWPRPIRGIPSRQGSTPQDREHSPDHENVIGGCNNRRGTTNPQRPERLDLARQRPHPLSRNSELGDGGRSEAVGRPMEGPIRLKSDARAHLKSIIDLIESSRQAYLRFHAGRPSRFQNAELKGRNRRRGSDCCASYGSPRVHHCGVPMAHAVCCASCPFLKYLGPTNSGRSGGTGSSHLTVVCSKGREGGIPWQGEAK